MHITPFGEKKFPLEYFVGHKHGRILVANKILYCIVLYCIPYGLNLKCVTLQKS